MRISLAALAGDNLLETAFAWLCQQRNKWPAAAADVWDLRARWPEAKAQLQPDLRAEQFRFGVLSRITLSTGEEVDLWSARDALVLKGLALVLGRRLPFSRRCVHVQGPMEEEEGSSIGPWRDKSRDLSRVPRASTSPASRLH